MPTYTSTQYIEITESFRDNNHGLNRNGWQQLAVAITKDGRWMTAANTRNEFPDLFTGDEPVVELTPEDFALTKEEDERYLILSQASIPYAKGISERLKRVEVPGSMDYWARWIEHSDGRVALKFSGYLYVHTKADRDELPEFIGGAITAQEKDGLKTAIDNNRHKPVLAHNFLPQSIIDNLKTRDEMVADGWF